MDLLEKLPDIPWLRTLVACGALVLLAIILGVLTRQVLVRLIALISRHTHWQWDKAMVKRRAFQRFARVVPALVIGHGISRVPGLPESVEKGVAALATAAVTVVVVLAINAALSALEDLYHRSTRGRQHTIRGYVQLLKILVAVAGIAVVISNLTGRSPLAMLTGLGAVSAVFLLIFRDTIMSVVASLQLGANDMLRVGDWIEVPGDDANGEVTEVALHMVKVRNWDQTIGSVPTWHLMSQSYRNYREMFTTGRRIQRALHIDGDTVHFLSDAETAHLRQFRFLQGWLQRRETELADWNAAMDQDGWEAVNHWQLTNIGALRAYMQALVDSHRQIRHDMVCTVRQLTPTSNGVPLEVYAYTVPTGFRQHNEVQGDLFDHFMAIIPEFGLSLFQEPAGEDVRALRGITAGQSPTDTGQAQPPAA